MPAVRATAWLVMQCVLVRQIASGVEQSRCARVSVLTIHNMPPEEDLHAGISYSIMKFMCYNMQYSVY